MNEKLFCTLYTHMAFPRCVYVCEHRSFLVLRTSSCNNRKQRSSFPKHVSFSREIHNWPRLKKGGSKNCLTVLFALIDLCHYEPTELFKMRLVSDELIAFFQQKRILESIIPFLFLLLLRLCRLFRGRQRASRASSPSVLSREHPQLYLTVLFLLFPCKTLERECFLPQSFR